MKNKFIILILGLLLQCCYIAPLSAEKRGPILGGGGTNFTKEDRNGLLTGTHSLMRHMFGVYTEGAFSTMLFYDSDACRLPIGHAYGGGVCYDLQRYYFKMQVGLGIRIQDMTTHVNDFTIYDDQVSDALGYPYRLKYDFIHRTDHFRKMHFQLPLLFGTGDKNLYALAGIKLDLTAYKDIKISSFASTSAVYDQFLGNFVEMDNHGLRKHVPITTTLHQPIKPFDWDLLASIEFGAEWGTEYNPIISRYRPASKPIRESEWRVRIAAFCDLGLLSTRNFENELVYIPSDYKWDFNRFQQNHVLYTRVSHKPSYPLNFYAGIKVTFFIGFIDYVYCVLCGDYESEKTLK